MAKEQAKINFRRNADEERRMRYLNAPKRLIGIDSQALDAQVAEMRQNRDDHKEADRMESTSHLLRAQLSLTLDIALMNLSSYLLSSFF